MEKTASIRKLTVAGVVLAGMVASTANAQVIFDTAGITDAGGDVTAWADADGNYSLTPLLNTGGTAPTLVTGGDFSYVDFNGTSLLQDTTATLGPAIGATTSALFFVLRSSGGNDSYLTWDDTTVLGTSYLGVSENLGVVQNPQRGGSDTSSISASVPTWDGDFHLLTIIRDGTSGEIRFDGELLPNQTGSFNGSMDLTTLGTLALGGRPPSTSDRFTGDLAEVRLYDTLPDIAAVEQELGATYGLNVVPEPSEYAMIFGLACVGGALALRYRRQASMAR